jgi:transcriptional regulator with XRE-family HTH domain
MPCSSPVHRAAGNGTTDTKNAEEMGQVNDDARRRELAEFLRTRRERLTPAAAGIPVSQHRRTPGLRREEVAELARIGTSWYTWLEQARDIRPSEFVLRRIASALRLDEAEERYLLRLALEPPRPQAVDEEVPSAILAMLHAFDGPACVTSPRWDLLAHNAVAEAVFDYQRIPHRNLLRNMFTRESQALFPDWERQARDKVSRFRAECAGLLREPSVLSLVDELKRASDAFRQLWAEHTVAPTGGGQRTVDHPIAGMLSFNELTLCPVDRPGVRIEVLVPDTDESRKRVKTLVNAHRKRKPLQRGETLED